MKPYERSSMLSARMIRLFLILVVAPLSITLLALDREGRNQIITATATLRRANRSSVMQEGVAFQQLGARAIGEANRQTASTSETALRDLAGKMEATQASSLAEAESTVRDVMARTLDEAMQRSLATHRTSLESVRVRLSRQIARATAATEQQASLHIQSAMLELTSALLQERAQRLTARLSDSVNNVPRYLQFTAQMLDMTPNASASRWSALDALVRRIPDFLDVAVLDSTGRELAESAANRLVTPREYRSYAGDPCFKAAMAGDVYVHPATDRSGDGAPVLRFSVPIQAYQGKTLGVLTALYSLSGAWDEIRSARIGSTGFACVLSQDGSTLLGPRSRPRSALVAAADLPVPRWRILAVLPRREAMAPVMALRQEIGQGGNAALSATLHDLDTIAASAASRLESEAQPVRAAAEHEMHHQLLLALRAVRQRASQQARLQLTTMQNDLKSSSKRVTADTGERMRTAANTASASSARLASDVADLALRQADFHFSIVAVLVLIFSCAWSTVAALVTAARIVRPVTRVAQVARAIASGDLDKRVDERAPDEIGDLAVAFNKMAESLRESRSELQDAEGQLVHSAKLASLGTLSAGVAHELNQPLAIIRGISQQLLAGDGLNEETRADLQLIEGQTGRMSKIVRHLRTFSRDGATDHALIDLNEPVHDCFTLIGAQLQSQGIQVQVELCEPGPMVLADRNELEQVLINLLTNARDALEGLENAAVRIRSCVVSGRAIVEVSDNGPGIPDQILPSIFDPFFTTKDVGKGTGLGLSISHSILKKHGGSISARNDRGALFTVELPLADVVAPSQAA